MHLCARVRRPSNGNTLVVYRVASVLHAVHARHANLQLQHKHDDNEERHRLNQCAPAEHTMNYDDCARSMKFCKISDGLHRIWLLPAQTPPADAFGQYVSLER
jgi:hypothetical protein